VEFRAYARTLLRFWALILALAALAALAAFGYSLRAPRIYRATAQLSVTPSVIEFFTGEAVQRLLSNYSLRLRSRLFAAQLADSARPALKPEQVAGKIRAVAAPSDYRIDIEVDDADPAVAQQVANAAATAFVGQIRDENAGKDRHDIAIDILEYADQPASPVSPRPKRDALGAGILGGLIGVGLAFLLEYWDDSVKSAEEASTLLGLPVLGAIPGTDGRRGVAALLRAFRAPPAPAMNRGLKLSR
jgi:capsular polysaccharide biosynthesis protein